MDKQLKLVLISDTHGYEPVLPPGDLLIHCGDWSGRGDMGETAAFIEWMESVRVNYPYGVVCVPGNHERFIESQAASAKRMFQAAGLALLINESIVINGVKIFGTPMTLPFCNW